MTSIYARPKPNASLAWSSNQQRETARHEYFSLLSLLETAVGSSRAAARGELFGSLKYQYNVMCLTERVSTMERFFTGLITTLSIPILLLNVLGGIIGGIWLMVAGEWSLFIGGLLYMMFGAMIIGLFLMPSLLFAAPAAAFAEKRKYVLFFIFGLLGIAYTYGLIAVSTYYVADITLSSQSAPLWASLLWLYAVVLAPWQYMASKEQDNTSTGMTTFFLALGVLALMVCIGIFGMTLGQAFPVLVVILVISLVMQLLFTYALTRAEKQATRHEDGDVIDIEQTDDNKRTWGDLE